MAVRLGKRLASKNAVDYLPLGDSHSITEVMPPKHFIGKTLRELQITNQYHCQVIALKVTSETSSEEEKEEDIKIPPEADDIITRNTVMVLIGKDSDIVKLQQKN